MRYVLLAMFAGWVGGCITDEAVTADDTQEVLRVNAEDGSSEDAATGDVSQSGNLDREKSNEDVKTSMPGASSTVAPRHVCC